MDQTLFVENNTQKYIHHFFLIFYFFWFWARKKYCLASRIFFGETRKLGKNIPSNFSSMYVFLRYRILCAYFPFDVCSRIFCFRILYFASFLLPRIIIMPYIYGLFFFCEIYFRKSNMTWASTQVNNIDVCLRNQFSIMLLGAFVENMGILIRDL